MGEVTCEDVIIAGSVSYQQARKIYPQGCEALKTLHPNRASTQAYNRPTRLPRSARRGSPEGGGILKVKKCTNRSRGPAVEHTNKNSFARRRGRSWREMRSTEVCAPSGKRVDSLWSGFSRVGAKWATIETETRCAHKGGAELTKEQQLCPSIRQ